MNRRRNRIASSLLPIGVGAVVAVLVAEAVLRIGFPRFVTARAGTSDPFWQHDARLGWVHRPGSEGRFVARGFDVAVRINSRGLRGPEYQARPGRQRILLLGDSVAWGWGVEEHEAVAGQLADDLPGWEVLNAATAGYSTDQQLLWYLDERAHYEAQVVVLLFTQSDFLGNARTEMHSYPKPYFALEESELRLGDMPVPRRPLPSRLRTWVKRHSSVSRVLAAGRSALRARVASNGPTLAPALRAEEARITRAILARLVAEVAGDGRLFVLALVPTTADRATWLLDLAEELAVPAVDLGPAFAGAEAAGERLVLPYDSHWNPAGHALAAHVLSAALRPLLPAPAAELSQPASPR